MDEAVWTLNYGLGQRTYQRIAATTDRVNVELRLAIIDGATSIHISRLDAFTPDTDGVPF